jgi:cytochrome o ubiquinol oxidase subunit 2
MAAHRLARAQPAASAAGGRGGLVALASTLFLPSCAGPSIFDTAGPVGDANRIILIDSLVIMLAIVIPTILGALWIAWWYRESNTRARFRPDFVFSGRIELIVWSIPLLVILFLGGLIWVGSHRIDPYRPIQKGVRPLEVQVVSLDWKWLFIYPDQGIASVNELVIPAGQPVHFSLTSASVMNTFFVPQLGSMIYTMNRMVTQLNLRADRPGTYYGRSAQFSGDGFPGMSFRTRAVPPAEFAAWAAGARGSGTALDAAGYRALERQSHDDPPRTYRAVPPGLFQAIATQAIPPQPGPSVGRPAPQVSPRAEG